jgi:hypothetical protein
MKVDKEFRNKHLIIKRKLHDGKTNQELFRFPNGYGGSIIKGPYSYGGDRGLFELAVIYFTHPTNADFTLCYDTHITDDVLGYLTQEEVDKYLKFISDLPKRKED